MIRLDFYHPQGGRNMSEILRAVKALVSTANKGQCLLTGREWVIGNQVIIPPAKTEAEVKPEFVKRLL